jgi:hypothetical protein
MLARSVTGLPTDGRTLYVRLWTMLNGGWQFNDYTYKASVAVSPAKMVSPVAGSTLPGTSTTFSWSAGTGSTGYWLYVGTTAGGNDLHNSNQLTSSTLSRSVTGLPSNGSPVYVRLWSLLNGAWQYSDYTYTAYKVVSSPKAQLITPVAGSQLPATTTFTWSAGTGATAYWLYVGKTVGGSEIFNSNSLATTIRSRIVTVPTTAGQPVYVRLWTMVNGGWQFTDYTYAGR